MAKVSALGMIEANRIQNMKLVGWRIAAAREISGLSQQELADQSGVSRCQITNIEAGRTDIPVTRLIRIAQALRVKPGRLMP